MSLQLPSFQSMENGKQDIQNSKSAKLLHSFLARKTNSLAHLAAQSARSRPSGQEMQVPNIFQTVGTSHPKLIFKIQVLQDPVSYFTIKSEFGSVSTARKMHGKEMCKAETSEMLASNLGERCVHREDIGSGCCKVDCSHYMKYSVYRCV